MSAKPVSDRTAKRRLLALAELLESPEVEDHFDFGKWGSVKRETGGLDPLDNAEVCGTTACALGWAPALPFARRLKVRLYASQFGGGFKVNGREAHMDRVAKILFGLTQDQSEMLFIPGHSPFPGAPMSNAKPAAVAANIRKFVAVRYG